MTKSIRNNIWIAGLVLGLGFAQTASALIVTDNYWGADPSSGVDTDSIGGLTFEIYDMNVNISASNILSVTIRTNYNQGASGTGFGDLFLASEWNPAGGAPYVDDKHDTGTFWEYGVSIDDSIHGGISKSHNRFTSAAGSTSLFSLGGTTNADNVNNVLLTNAWYPSGGTHRSGQEVAVDLNSGTVTDTSVDGSYSSWTAGLFKYLNFEIDLTGTSLEDDNEIALHWTMTCGNDVIEGPGVPEPGILALLAAGLLGFGLTIARRKRQ